MKGASLVACASQAVLSGYVASALGRGAKSPGRRILARAVLAFAGYAAANGVGYVVASPWDDVAFDVCNLFALASALGLLLFAGTLSREAPEPTRRTPWWWRAIFVLGAAITAESMVRSLRGGDDSREAAAVGVVTLCVMLAVNAILARTTLRNGPRRGAARAFLLATVWPLAPLVYHIANNLGASGAWYGLVRNVSILLFLYLLLIAYLDHADEPMRIEARFVASTLTVVLALVGVAAEVLLRDDGDAIRLLLLMIGASVLVFVAFPRFHRRNLVEPLDRLVAGMRRLEDGARDVSLPVSYDDELGYVTGSFNHLVTTLGGAERDLARRVDELAGKNAEVRALNDELREQIAARSRELAEALERAQPGGAKPLATGDVVDGKYRVGRVLGAGGMGTVYEVERARDGRRLALKVVPTTTSESIARFAREAQIAAPLEHDNLVSIVDVGVWRSVAYLVMELVEGGSLESQRARFGDVAWAMPILAQVACALAALHERGVVHRDLKPANVLLSGAAERPKAKITDFGIAFQEVDALADTLHAPASVLTRLTATGVMIGTLPYMAPEFILEGSRKAGPPADVFALGLIAYEMTTGRPAFDVPPILVARSGLPAPHPLPDTIAREVAAALRAFLASDPAKRPTAAALANTLR